MKTLNSILAITLLASFCAFLIWWKAWFGIPYTIIWILICYELNTAVSAPPHEQKYHH